MSLAEDNAIREIAEVENALFDGCPADVLIGPHIKSATREASDRLGVDRHKLKIRVGTPQEPGRYGRQFGFIVDWSMYRPRATPGVPKTIALRPGAVAPVGATEPEIKQNWAGAAGHDRITEAASPHRVPAAARTTRRYLLTAAQDETPVSEPFWANLTAYADKIGAEIMVGGFTYQKGLFEDHAVQSNVFAQEVAPYIRAEIVELGESLLWYGRANILPTATDPLSGWETNTRDKWGVFPHAKIALRAVPVMPGAPGKQIMTTGVVTLPNYVQRNAGQKSEFHHTIGATIAEVCADGVHFCRQIAANKDGSFQDLEYLAKDGVVTAGPNLEAVTWGDIHREFLDRDVARGSWGFDIETNRCDESLGSILDVLKPGSQLVHDSFNFTARSHHTRNDPHERVMRRAENRDEVELEMVSAAKFLGAIRRPWSKVVHVDSNHNQHLHRWLKDDTAFHDPVNARYWCEVNAAALRAAEQGDEEFLIHEYALRKAALDRLDGVVFLRAGESYVVCQGVGPIECGLHADRGPNGARGSAISFAKTVERVTGAHGHTPIIREAYYQAPTSSQLDLKFNSKSQGNWANGHVFAYQNGKRTIVTMHGSRWRA